jgi:hypothetical protein
VTKPLALSVLALVASATFAPPATAALPCRDLTMTVPQCTQPLRDRLENLCVPVVGC